METIVFVTYVSPVIPYFPIEFSINDTNKQCRMLVWYLTRWKPQYVLCVQTIRNNTDQCMTVSRIRVPVRTSSSTVWIKHGRHRMDPHHSHMSRPAKKEPSHNDHECHNTRALQADKDLSGLVVTLKKYELVLNS